MEQQKILSQRLLTIAFAVLSGIVFAIVAIRCATVPFNFDETETFYNFIQQGSFLPYLSHLDAGNHVLNSFLSWICFKTFGDSPFSLRLPNLLALIVLISAVARISRNLNQLHSKLILIAGFLLSFHWLSFYSVCRGYGLSMSFLILGISYLIEYFNSKKFKKLILFYLCIQLTICASQAVLVVAVILTIAVIFFQFSQKVLLKKSNIFLLIAHISLLFFWAKFSLFLQTNGALYLGENNTYWNNTFLSLVDQLTGSSRILIPYFIISAAIVLVILSITMNYKKVKHNFLYVFTPSLFYTLILISLIIAVYAMNLLLNVNYPQNRAALFFYVFFVILATFTIDLFTNIPVKVISCFILVGALFHFTLNLNFHKHSVLGYETIPERFYTRLLQEQQSSPERITIGGILEAEYAYWNYTHGGERNTMDDQSNKMYMNCDYVITWRKVFKPYYKPYYDEIDIDKDMIMVLLKRKEKIKRNLLLSIDTLKAVEGNEEFYNLYSIKDTSFKNFNPLLVEFDLAWVKAKTPLNAFLVLQIDSAEGRVACYKRIPLNWVRYDWNNTKNQQLCMVSGQLPQKIYRLTCYLWNNEKTDIQFKIDHLLIYQLEGKGVNIKSVQPDYYFRP